MLFFIKLIKFVVKNMEIELILEKNDLFFKSTPKHSFNPVLIKDSLGSIDFYAKLR